MNMRQITIVLISLFASASMFAADVDRSADREAIRKHIDVIFNAYIHQDRETVRKTHSEDWRGFLTQSRSIIRGIDEYMSAADNSLKFGGLTGYRMVDYDISFHGDIAIINYVAEIDWKDGDTSGTGKLRVLDVYEKRKGDWIQIASNTATHPDIVRQQIEAARKSATKQ